MGHQPADVRYDMLKPPQIALIRMCSPQYFRSRLLAVIKPGMYSCWMCLIRGARSPGTSKDASNSSYIHSKLPSQSFSYTLYTTLGGSQQFLCKHQQHMFDAPAVAVCLSCRSVDRTIIRL